MKVQTWKNFPSNFILSLIILFTLNASAQSEDRPSSLTAVKIANGSLKLDGRLSERFWEQAIPADNFLTTRPDEGLPANRATEVRFVYDDNALYIGGKMYCEEPSRIITRISRRDAASNSERLIISLDTFRDRRTAYSFGITASGVRVDYYHPSDEERSRDYNYDPVWSAKTRIDAEGWTTEIRIPFSQLRFNNVNKQIWGVNINRWTPDINEDSYWIFIPSYENGWSSKFGVLEGIEGVRPSRGVEFLPYTAAELTFDNSIDDDNPFLDKTDLDQRAGVDFKIGLGPNLTLDATVNPDFGQVEADPAEVNLSAFETFFDERRPFFTEGDQLLQGFGPNYYYSRRIGANPHLNDEEALEELYEVNPAYSSFQGNTTILGASKLTGRLNSGLSIGAVAALTAREYARIETTAGEEERFEIAPATGFGVLRLQQEFGKDASALGLTFTGVERDVASGTALAEIVTRSAYSGGVDWSLRFSDNAYSLTGHAGFSHIRGDAAALLHIQQSSAHYFQRPDADYLELDATRTSLSGYSASVSFRKNSGRHWLYQANFWVDSPGLELNDIGRLHSADDIFTNGRLVYRETVPGKLFRRYTIEFGTANRWDFGGERQGSRAEIELTGVFPNFWRGGIEIGYDPRVQSNRLTRGGPYMQTGDRWSVELELGSNFAASTRWEAEVEFEKGELGDWAFSTGVGYSMHFGDRLELSTTPYFERGINTRQYIEEIAGGNEATFGNRYIFGTIDQRTIATRFRLNYAFTPSLTLELYAEPFAAKGYYYNFGELEAARSRFLRMYGLEGTTLTLDEENTVYQVSDAGSNFSFERPDFNVLSFRSNLVLRWEWLPGSSFFLVWQQDRGSDEMLGKNIGAGSLLNAFGSEGNNFFALKLNYWLPVK